MSPPTRWLALPAIAIGAIAVLCYWHGLGGPLLLDDGPALDILLEHGVLAADWRSRIISTTGPLGRPVAMLSFIANAAVDGGDFFYWKLTNLVLHLLAGAALWWVATGLFSSAAAGRPRRPALAALAVTALWLLHPLQVSTVLYTVQRMAVLSALFAALGMGTYLAGRRAMREGRVGWPGILAAYALFLPLAAFSKESGLLLPCYLAVIEFVVLAPRGADRRSMLILHGVLFGVPALCVAAYYASHFDTALLRAYELRGMTLGARLMTEGRVLVLYLAQIVTPAGRQLGFFHDDIAMSTSWLAPPTTLLSALGLLGLLGAAIAVRRRLPLVSVGILLFFTGHLLESTIIPLELMFEHRNYLPSFGILLALVGATFGLGAGYARFHAASTGVALCLLALLTWHQAGVWSRLETLLPASYALHPDSETAAANLAELVSNDGRIDVALKILGRIRTPGARLHERYLRCKRDGRLAAGELTPAQIEGLPAIDSYVVTGLIELAKLGLDDLCRYDFDEFGRLLAVAAAKPVPQSVQRYKLEIYEAHIAWKQGDHERALALLAKARKSAPRDPTPAMLATEWLLAMGENTRAAQMLDEAKRLVSPDRADIQRTIAALEEALRGQVTR